MKLIAIIFLVFGIFACVAFPPLGLLMIVAGLVSLAAKQSDKHVRGKALAAQRADRERNARIAVFRSFG